MAEWVGTEWKNLQDRKVGEGKFLMAAPLSSSAVPIYDWVLQHAKSFQSWNHFRFILMDEQIEDGTPLQYVSPEDDASYLRFAQRNFLDQLSSATRESLEEMLVVPTLSQFDDANRLLYANGGFDLLILAVGVDGHYAQVMPGTDASEGFHIATLTSPFRSSHTGSDGHSYPGAKFRSRGMSLGPVQVISAKRVIVVVSGTHKRHLAKELLARDSFDRAFPISIVHEATIRNRVTILLSDGAFESA